VRIPGAALRPVAKMNHINYSGYLFRKNFSSTTSSTEAGPVGEVINEAIDTLTAMPDQITIKANEIKSTEHIYVDEGDFANITPALQPLNDANTSNIGDIIGSLSPNSLYETMDYYSREALLYVAHDLNMGMGWAIILVSLGIRSVFLPLIGATQLNAVKMKLLEPEMKNFQNTVQKYQRAGDFKGSREARKVFSALRERYGINNFLPFLSLSQIPVLITWFLSLRYVANAPDLFPSIKTDGFLWFKDLSAYDPYFVLPVISAFISYHNIQISTLNANSAIGGPFARYTRYLKYFPFLTIPFVGFFPAALNIYWITTALVQLLISMCIRSTAFRRAMGIPEYLPGSILEKLHGGKKPDIVKTVFTVDKNVEDAVKATTVGAQASHAQATTTTQAKPKPTPTSTGPQKTVEVFTNKPKKPKH